MNNCDKEEMKEILEKNFDHYCLIGALKNREITEGDHMVAFNGSLEEFIFLTSASIDKMVNLTGIPASVLLMKIVDSYMKIRS